MFLGPLDRLASARGDGLRPELRELLAHAARSRPENVVDLPVAAFVPPPAASLCDRALPANVVRFDSIRRDGQKNLPEATPGGRPCTSP
jgi:hypothetical protein